MPELRTSLVIDLAGNLQRRAMAAQRAVGGIGRSGTAQFALMNRAMSRSSSGLLAFGARSFALLGGALAVRRVALNAMAIEERRARLGVRAQRSTEDMLALWKKVQDTAASVNLDPAKLFGAGEEIQEMVGDLEFFEANLLNLARALQATGAEGHAIGGLAAELQKLDIRQPEAVAAALDKLIGKGDKGAFTLEALAALGPRLFAAYSATGRSGPNVVDEIGTAIQMIRGGVGSAEQATTAFEAMLRTLQDADKVKFLTRSGIRVFEDDGTTLRPITELMKEIVLATGGEPLKLSRVFDAEAMRAFSRMNAEFRAGRGFDLLESIERERGQGRLKTDAASIAKTASQRVGSATSRVSDKAAQEAAPIVERGAEFVEDVLERGWNEAFERLDAEMRQLLLPPGFRASPRRPPVTLEETTRRLAEDMDAPARARERLQQGLEGRLQVDIDVRAEPGLRATPRVRQVPEGIDVDTGPMMPESAR
jgi:hypothetical protein